MSVSNQTLHNDLSKVFRRLAWSDNKHIKIDLKYEDKVNRRLYFLLTDNHVSFEFVVEYQDKYPNGNLKFYGDWMGSCDTSEYCYWLNNVEKETANAKTIDNVIETAVKWFNITTNEINKATNFQISLSEGLEEFEEYDPDVETTPTIIRNVDLNNVLGHMLHKYINSKHKLTVNSDGTLSLKLEIRDTEIMLNINVNVMTYKHPPIVTLVTPRLKFDGRFPVTPQGLLVIKNLNPIQWEKWVSNQISNSLDMDFIKLIISTFENLPFAINDIQEPYDQDDAISSYNKLMPIASHGIYDKQMKVSVNSSLSGNLIQLSSSIYGEEYMEIFESGETPVFQLTTESGLSTVCGLSSVHQRGERDIFVSQEIMKNLLMVGSLPVVNVSFVQIPYAEFIKIRPLDSDIKDLDELAHLLPKNHVAVTQGDIVTIDGNNFEIVECEPEKSVRTRVSYGELEINFDIAPSLKNIKKWEQQQEEEKEKDVVKVLPHPTLKNKYIIATENMGPLYAEYSSDEETDDEEYYDPYKYSVEQQRIVKYQPDDKNLLKKRKDGANKLFFAPSRSLASSMGAKRVEHDVPSNDYYNDDYDEEYLLDNDYDDEYLLDNDDGGYESELW